MKLARPSLTASITALALSAGSAVLAADQYVLTQMPIPDGWFGMEPLAINDHGHVIGTKMTGFFQMPEGFYFDGEETHIFGQDLIDAQPYPSWQVGVRPLVINNNGHVLLTLEIVDVGAFSYIWDGEHYSEIAPAIPPGDYDFADASAGTMNNLGQVAGAMRFIKNNPLTLWYRGFIWDPATDETTIIDPPAPFTDAGVAHLSDTGYATGFFMGGAPATAYIWKDGELTLFEGIDDDDFISISGRVNDHGNAGSFTTNQPPPGTPSLSRVYLWSKDGIHYWSYPTDGLTGITVYGINNSNEVVGTMLGPQQPFHFHNGVMRNLNNHIVQPVEDVTLDLWDAYDINENGQITAHGQFLGTGDWTNYAFILTPKPTCAPADLNCDGSVGVADLLILLAAWGPCPRSGTCPADLNGDGFVGVSDLLYLLANWG